MKNKIKDNVSRIKAKFSIYNLCRDERIDLKEIGINKYRAICPFCKDTSYSFYLFSDSGNYLCYSNGCKRKGSDIINLYADLKGISNNEAIRRLSSKLSDSVGSSVEGFASGSNIVGALGNSIERILKLKEEDLE